MNVLYLHAHDLGRWIAPCGLAATPRTPFLAALAESEGTRNFRQMHSAAPTCSPSRAALLTGATPHESGMMGLMHRGFRLRRPRGHLAAWLQDEGFDTALAGIQHIQPGAELTGYAERHHPEKPRLPGGEVDWRAWDAAVAEAAAGYLAERGRGRRGQPFFLDCGFWLPHRPFPPPEEEPEAAWALPPPGIADIAAHRADMGGFLAATRHMDRCCGRVLEALESAGLAEQTLVLFTTDHGPAFPGYKGRLTGKGTGVAMLLRLPRALAAPGPRVIDGLASQMDLAPTLRDFLGLEHPPWVLRGESLRPLLEGRDTRGRDAVHAESAWHAAYEPARSIRTASHSLVKRFDDDARPVPANVDDSAAKDTWIAAGGLENPLAPVELYDLRLDPGETRNLAEEPALAETRAALEERLARWMAETEDPLLRGPVPLPPGGYGNTREHLSPSIGETGS